MNRSGTTQGTARPIVAGQSEATHGKASLSESKRANAEQGKDYMGIIPFTKTQANRLLAKLSRTERSWSWRGWATRGKDHMAGLPAVSAQRVRDRQVPAALRRALRGTARSYGPSGPSIITGLCPTSHGGTRRSPASQHKVIRATRPTIHRGSSKRSEARLSVAQRRRSPQDTI